MADDIPKPGEPRRLNKFKLELADDSLCKSYHYYKILHKYLKDNQPSLIEVLEVFIEFYDLSKDRDLFRIVNEPAIQVTLQRFTKPGCDYKFIGIKKLKINEIEALLHGGFVRLSERTAMIETKKMKHDLESLIVKFHKVVELNNLALI